MIKLRLEVVGTILTVDILDQHPSITATRHKRMDFKASNGIYIRSLRVVGAYNNALHIRGYGSIIPSQCCASIQCNTVEEAQELKLAYLGALEEWKESGYFSNPDSVLLKQTVFEF